jgi:hypothetical protein
MKKTKKKVGKSGHWASKLGVSPPTKMHVGSGRKRSKKRSYKR